MRSEPPSDLVRSVSRACRVLEEVGRHPEGLSPKQVARRCGLRLSTAYHLLRTLRYEGYLERLSSGDYVLGLQIADRFRELAMVLRSHPQAGRVVHVVAGDTGHSCYLARFVAGVVTLTDVADGPGSPHLEDLLVGFHDGAHATALGKALLSTLPPRQRHAYLREHGMRRFTTRTVAAPDALDAELAAHGDRRLFVEYEQFRRNVACAGSLVRVDGQWAALAVSARPERLDRVRRALLGALEQAGADLVSGVTGRA